MQSLILFKIPIPPSINKQLLVSKGRMIKTIEARRFSHSIDLYILKNFRIIEEIKYKIEKDSLLSVDFTFVFHKDRIIGKKNQIKSLDVSNYIKSTQDAIVKIIGIDDKFFIDHKIRKVICEKASDEQVIVEISKSDLLSFEKIEF